MSTLSTTELEAQVSTDLSDTALQAVIDAVEAEIDAAIGPATGQVVEYGDLGNQGIVWLPKAAASITSVDEYTDSSSDPTITTLSADDYQLSDDGWTLRRLSDGTNPRGSWTGHVVVTFAEVSDTARRKQVAVELCKLRLASDGYESEKVGDWSATVGKNVARREAQILGVLDDLVVGP